MSENFLKLFHGLFILVLRAHVDLSENDEEGDLEEQTEPDVFLGHFLKTHVGSDHNTAKIRRKTCESVDGRFEVLFVAAEIDH